MTEFHFYGTWNDSWEICDSILRDGRFQLILDIKWDSPNPSFLTACDETSKALLRECRSIYISSPLFSTQPPAMVLVTEGQNKGKYFVDERSGGPLLRLMMPPCYSEGGTLHLGHGEICRPTWTVDPETECRVAVPPNVKLGYEAVRGIIKKHLEQINVPKSIWAGAEARSLIVAKAVVIDPLF